MPGYTLFDKGIDISKLNVSALVSMLHNIEQILLDYEKKRDCIVKELETRGM